MARRGSNNDDIVVNGDGSYDYNDIDGDLELRGNFRLPDIPNPSSAPRCPDDDEDDNDGYGNDDDDGGYNPLLSSEYDDEEIDNTNNVGLERLGSAGSSHSSQPREPRVYSQRWVQLLYLSLLALLSDWVCFSTSSIPRAFAHAFPGHTSEGLIDIFLFTNVLSCLIVTDCIAQFGLMKCVKSCSILMMVGCWLRCGLGIVPATCDMLGIRRHRHSRDNSSDDDMDSMITKLIIKLLESHYHSSGEIIFGLPNYTILTIGTVLVGFAQPFFQCTPPLLSAVWFASNERATSSAIALNFNQVGIAAALIVGGYMVDESTYSSSTNDFDYTNINDGNYSSSIIIDNRSDYDRVYVDEDGNLQRTHNDSNNNDIDPGFTSGITRIRRDTVNDANDDGLIHYFALVAVLSTVLCIGTCYHFQESPPSPPSASEIGKSLDQHHYHHHNNTMLRRPLPFYKSVYNFSQSKGFMRPLVAFIYSIAVTNVVGAFIEEVMERGGVTDRRSIAYAGCGFEMAIVLGGIILGRYVDRTKQYKSVTLLCIIASLIFVLPLGLTQHKLGQEPRLLVTSLFLLGFFVGPVQPINAELAVDITFPGDETAVESVQQFGGNLVSAMLVPVVGRAAKLDYQLLSSIPWLASDIRGDVLLMMALAIATLYFYRSFDAPLRRSMVDSG
jgi:predicted MFS family arabinose efflux permease